MSNKVLAAVGIMILKNNKVLLGKRHTESEKAKKEEQWKGTWTMPGGTIEFGEKPEEAAKREVMEESGIKVNFLKLLSITNDIFDNSHFITMGFLCEDFEGSPKLMEPDKITEWKWFSLSELPEPIFSPSEKIVKNYLDKEIYKN